MPKHANQGFVHGSAGEFIISAGCRNNARSACAPHPATTRWTPGKRQRPVFRCEINCGAEHLLRRALMHHQQLQQQHAENRQPQPHVAGTGALKTLPIQRGALKILKN